MDQQTSVPLGTGRTRTTVNTFFSGSEEEEEDEADDCILNFNKNRTNGCSDSQKIC